MQKLGLLSDPMKEFKEEADKSKQTTDQLSGDISAAKEETKGAAEAAEKLAKANKSAAEEAIRASEASEAIRQNNIKLFSAEKALQQTLLDIEQEKAQRQLENAKTVAEVIRASDQLYKLAIHQAKLDREIAKLKNDSAVSELKLKTQIIEATYTQAQAERAVLQAKGKATDKIDQTLSKLEQEVTMTKNSLAVQEQIAAIQNKQVDAVYKQAVETAKLTREKQIQEGKERISKELNDAKTGALKEQTAEMQKQAGALAQQNATDRQNTNRPRGFSF